MTDHDLSDLMDRLGERTDVAPAPVAAMLTDAAHQRRRRTTVRATLAAASVVAVVGGTALTVATLGDDDRSGEPAPSTTGPMPEPTPVLLPEGMRLVGIGATAIAVPEEWGTNQTQCGTPTNDTVVIDQGVICLAQIPRPEGVESIEIQTGRYFEFDGAEKQTTPFEVNGLTGERIETTCRKGGRFGPQETCRSLVYLPSADLTFIAESSTEGSARDEVDRILSRIQLMPDGLVAVPGTSDILYGNGDQSRSGALYGELLAESQLAVRFVEETHPASIPDFIVGVDPVPGTVVPVGSEVVVRVVADHAGPADEITVGMNSAASNGTQGPVQLTDREIKNDAEIRLGVGDHLWLYGVGQRENTLAGGLHGDGNALVRDTRREVPEYPYARAWIAESPGVSTITVTIEVGGRRLVLGTVTVIVE